MSYNRYSSGVIPVQVQILYQLFIKKRKISTNELTEIMQRTVQAIHRSMAHLINRGLVEKELQYNECKKAYFFLKTKSMGRTKWILKQCYDDIDTDKEDLNNKNVLRDEEYVRVTT